MLKLNCDDSFLPKVKSGSWGFLIRDCDRVVIAVGRGKIGNNLLNAFQAELIACLQGLHEAISLEISWLILETDAQEVVRALESEADAASVFGYLVEEIKSLPRLNLSSFEGCFVKRVCNVAAREQAGLGHVCTFFSIGL